MYLYLIALFRQTPRPGSNTPKTMRKYNNSLPQLQALESEVKSLSKHSAANKNTIQRKFQKGEQLTTISAPQSQVLSPTSAYLERTDQTDSVNIRLDNKRLLLSTTSKDNELLPSSTITVPGVRNNVAPATAVHNINEESTAQDSNTQSNLTMIDDWDMLSEEEGEKSDLPVSFSLTSDVVMASMSQDDICDVSSQEEGGTEVVSPDNPHQCVSSSLCSSHQCSVGQ